jgi:hypothetical protein
LRQQPNNSRYCTDFPFKDVAITSSYHLQQISPQLVRWYKCLCLPNSAAVDRFHWSLLVFGNVDSAICHVAGCCCKRQVDWMFRFRLSVWWVPGLGLSWLLAVSIVCGEANINFVFQYIFVGFTKKSNFDKCVYPDYV